MASAAGILAAGDLNRVAQSVAIACGALTAWSLCFVVHRWIQVSKDEEEWKDEEEQDEDDDEEEKKKKLNDRGAIRYGECALLTTHYAINAITAVLNIICLAYTTYSYDNDADSKVSFELSVVSNWLTLYIFFPTQCVTLMVFVLYVNKPPAMWCAGVWQKVGQEATAVVAADYRLLVPDKTKRIRAAHCFVAYASFLLFVDILSQFLPEVLLPMGVLRSTADDATASAFASTATDHINRASAIYDAAQSVSICVNSVIRLYAVAITYCFSSAWWQWFVAVGLYYLYSGCASYGQLFYSVLHSALF